MRFERSQLLGKFREQIKAKIPIIGGGAGTGLSAKCEEAGGIDLIVIYNSGRYRMAGRGSLAGLLAYGNANEIVVDMAREVLPVVKHTPVLAGVNGTDPFCQFDPFLDQLEVLPVVKHTPVLAGVNGTDPFCQFDPFLDQLKEIGFAGIQNFPTVGLIDGKFRANLEETGMGYAMEVDLVRLARSKDMLTTPYVFSVEDARAMTEAGADIIVAHMGLTTGGTIGADTALTLQDCVGEINAIAAAARAINPDIIILCHGGPIAEPEDARYILQQCPGCHGFYGASSMERLPVEKALVAQTQAFKNLIVQQ